MTAATMQSNKIISSEVKENEELLEPISWKKTNVLFGLEILMWKLLEYGDN